MPVTLTLDGGRSETDIKLDGPALRWRHRIDLGNRREGGWGSFALSGDANLHDNTAYFVYGPDVAMRAVAVSTERPPSDPLRYAAATRRLCRRNGFQSRILPALPSTAFLFCFGRRHCPGGVEADRVQWLSTKAARGFLSAGGT